MASTLGQFNPLRYRGYVYDNETQLYYLQSRYYDPEIGRFINADGYTSTGQGFTGNNMFAYCGNNPVCRSDYGGDRYCEATTIAGESVYNRFLSCNFQKRVTLENHGLAEDITQKLNSFMQDNANALKAYYNENGFLATCSYFYNLVDDGKNLDIKLNPTWAFEKGKIYYYNGMVLRFDDPGNINFGYLGAAFSNEVLVPKGLAKIILCCGAGRNQRKKYGYKYGDITTFFDDPRDNWMIRYGFNLY